MPSGRYMDWSHLREDYAELKSSQSIAEKYGIHRTTVVRALHRHGIPLGPRRIRSRSGRNPIWTSAELDELHELLGTMPASDIAEQMGRSLGAVKQKANGLGRSVHFPQRWVDCKRCGCGFLSSWSGPQKQVCTSCRMDYLREKSRRHESGPHYEEALHRADYACERCGSKRDILIHHRDGNGHAVPRDQQNHALENLEVLCRPCHRSEHSRRVGKEALKEWGRRGMAAMRKKVFA